MPNISQIQVGTTTYDLIDSTKASINSPIFEGIPQAPTATSTENSDQIATTKFVQNLFSSIDGSNLDISISTETLYIKF